MTVEPTPPPASDLSARPDVRALLSDVPAIADPDDLAVDGIFESDDEVEDFLRSVRDARDAGVA